MEACLNAYEMRMPAHYVDMNKDEMDYDGGWFWSAALIVAGLVVTAIGHYTGNEGIQTFGTVLGVAGIVLTGVGAVTMATSTAVTTAEAATFAAGVASDGLTYGQFAYGYAKSRR